MLIRLTIIIIVLSSKWCISTTTITDIRIQRLIKDIFYIPPSGLPYFNVSVPTKASNICLHGICVPIHLCVNGHVLTSGANLLGPRIGLEPEHCSELEECCILSYDDNEKSYSVEKELNSQVDEISKIGLDKLGDSDVDYTDTWRPKCGVRNFSLLQPRISVQDKAENMEFPWMVMIMRRLPKNNFYDYKCGGSLIHESVVLTAAHCVLNIKPKFLYARLGEWDMANTDEDVPHQDRNIQSVIIHSNFYKPTLLNDIAILILSEPVELAENVNTVCLPPPNYSFDKERCLVTGWGKDSKGPQGKFQTVLKKVELPIVPNTKCQTMFRNTILGKHFRLDDTFICAGAESGKDSCKGDGGSPLVCLIPGTSSSYYQSGIVSWGIGCNESNIPGAYINVARFRDWIDKVMLRLGLEIISYIHE